MFSKINRHLLRLNRTKPRRSALTHSLNYSVQKLGYTEEHCPEMRFSLVVLVCLAATASAQSDCGDTSHYGPSGVISSPNYPGDYYDYLNCTYNIFGQSSNSSFTLVFNSFNTEQGWDYVTISCPTNSSFTPLTYSGQLSVNPISIPWCSQARVKFTTDVSNVRSGFSLDYSAGLGDCRNTVYGGSHGYVGSPSYPAQYGPNQNCSNIIYASQQSHFHLRFLLLDMSDSVQNCSHDWVEISCYDNNPSDKRRFCGEFVIAFDIFQCTQVLVWFHSNSRYGNGFYLEYFIFPDGGTGTGTGSSMSYTSSRTSSRTSGSSWSTTYFSTRFTGPSTQTPPVVDCGNTDYFGPSGVISSPNHPDDYPNYLACDYYITASSSSSSIALIFKEFDTEKCCDFVTISCPTNSSHPSVTYSGFSLPQPFSIAWCSKGAINFSTNDATVNTGFTLDYHISLGGCGDTVFTGSHGYVSSPYYPSNYGDNQNCSNIIWASQRSSFAITFQYMSVEECCDYVELSCLDNAEFGSHRFTGTTIPDKLEIPGCTQVLVWFNSDDSVAQTGFNLEYLVTPEQVFAV